MTKDDEILVLRPLHPAPDPVVDERGRVPHLDNGLLSVVVKDLEALALQLEKDRAIFLVRPAGRPEPFEVFPVNRRAFALQIGAASPPCPGALVPSKPQPFKAVVDHIQELVAVSGPVGVLDPQDEGSAGVAGVEPVEQRCPGAPNVEESGRARGETYAYLGHEWKLPGFRLTVGKVRRSIVRPVKR
jgi:hypothetical protein